MEGVKMTEKLAALVKKNKYVVLVLALGVAFMLIPERKETTVQAQEPQSMEKSQDLEESLERILSSVQGAGRVEVLLTQSAGEEILYQTDLDRSIDSQMEEQKEQTLIITDGSRGQQAVVRQVLPPSYLGAIVVCQGGDHPEVRLAIVQAVAKATGLTTDRITVLKMK